MSKQRVYVYPHAGVKNYVGMMTVNLPKLAEQTKFPFASNAIMTNKIRPQPDSAVVIA